jgi:hypothetical protein
MRLSLHARRQWADHALTLRQEAGGCGLLNLLLEERPPWRKNRDAGTATALYCHI